MKSKLKTLLMSGVFAASGLTVAGAAFAEVAADDTADDPSIQERIVVTGARGKPRSITDSPVPVDVLSEEDLSAVPFTDTNDILRTLVPSYSLSRQPISDGGTFVRPAQLRGLPTDKTLVLVNSKRRHRAALVQIGGSGTQGPDIATIPTIALKSVEVLRDGAAAQYGSDAIAGVINFILKDSAEGGAITADFGQYYEGDGTQYTVAGNVGLPIGDSGFFSVSAELSDVDASVRAEQYCESFACVDVNDDRFLSGIDTTIAGFSEESFLAGLPSANIGPGDVVQPWGQPNSEAVRGFFNTGYTFDTGVELYGFGNYSDSTADGGFFYRYPGNGTIENLRLEDGSVYSPLSIFPGGFTPRFFGDVVDYSIVGGVRAQLDNGLSMDFSGRFGHNEISYTLTNTINPSLGPDTPTSFNPGELINEEVQFQADFTYEAETGLASPLLFAFGGSLLEESYELVGGDPASFAAGPFAGADPFDFCNAPIDTDMDGVPDTSTESAIGLNAIANGSTLVCQNFTTADLNMDGVEDDGIAGIDPAFRTVGVGSNGFPGYSPEFSGDYSRDSYSIYADLSADITDALFLQGALRFEDYSDFGDELVWKLAGRYEFSDMFALRGSVGTGFRAPTPGQQGTTNVSTRLPNGLPVATGLFPANGPIAQALGATPLKPETSTNYTVGATSSFGDFTLTVDFYQIDLEDRVNAISTQSVSSDPTAGTAYDNFLALEGAGVVGAESIGGVFYFTNAFDTTTQGVDVVGTYAMDWAGGAQTNFTGSVNYNTTEFDSEVDDLFDAESQFDFENGLPNWRGVFTVTHETGPLTLLARANYYGAYKNSNGSGTITAIQEFDPEVQFDIEASYDLSDAVKVSLGVRNLFDEYPAPGEIGETCCGRIYRSDSIVDWQGGYYYARVRADF